MILIGSAEEDKERVRAEVLSNLSQNNKDMEIQQPTYSIKDIDSKTLEYLFTYNKS